MTKLIVFFILLWLSFTAVEWIYINNEDVSYVARTKLMMELDGSNIEKACVDDIKGFQKTGKIYIDREVVSYREIKGNCFMGLGRELENTKRETHKMYATVRSEVAGALYLSGDVRIITSGTEEETDSALTEAFQLMLQFPKFLTFNYKFMDEPLFGELDLSGIKLIFQAVAVASTFVIAAYSASKFGAVGKVIGALVLAAQAAGAVG